SVLRTVESQRAPVSTATLARATGLHENTVRGHLEQLLADGYVARVCARSSGRGRPDTIDRMPVELSHVPAPAPAPARRGRGATRLRLDLSYDGTDFHGWAAQPGQRTVQGELEKALGRIARVPARVTVAGRTDAGVHARGQVCHLDLPDAVLATLPGRSQRSPAEALVTRLAGVLPEDVVVHVAREVPDDFGARSGATWRRYRARSSDGQAAHAPLRRGAARGRRGACGPRAPRPLRRPVRCAVAPLPLPDLGRPRRPRPAAPGRAAPSSAVGRRGDGAGERSVAGRARLPLLLQAARGGEHRPRAAGAALGAARRGPGRRRADRRHRGRRCLLPPHGPLPGGRADLRGGGPTGRVLAGRGARRPHPRGRHP